jgi:F-type H+-transporting ATPase subunit a
VQLWNLPDITIAPDLLFGGFVTNTLLLTWIAIICLVGILFIGTRRMQMVPSGLQNAIEWVVDFLQNMVDGVAGKERGKKFFPFVATFFLFILFCNLIDVLPGVDTIGSIKGNTPVAGPFLTGQYSNAIVPWLRPPTTDLNLTLAMALVSVVATQYMGFATLGAKEQISKYFNFRALFRGGLGIVDFVAGIFELISELGRLISFSFRLFGNVFAGSVLLAVFAFLLPVVATVIFIPFEIFVAVIQAYVFAFLTLLFMTVGTTSHSQHEHGEEGFVSVQEQEQEQLLTVPAQR